VQTARNFFFTNWVMEKRSEDTIASAFERPPARFDRNAMVYTQLCFNMMTDVMEKARLVHLGDDPRCLIHEYGPDTRELWLVGFSDRRLYGNIEITFEGTCKCLAKSLSNSHTICPSCLYELICIIPDGVMGTFKALIPGGADERTRQEFHRQELMMAGEIVRRHVTNTRYLRDSLVIQNYSGKRWSNCFLETVTALYLPFETRIKILDELGVLEDVLERAQAFEDIAKSLRFNAGDLLRSENQSAVVRIFGLLAPWLLMVTIRKMLQTIFDSEHYVLRCNFLETIRSLGLGVVFENISTGETEEQASERLSRHYKRQREKLFLLPAPPSPKQPRVTSFTFKESL